MEEVCIRPDAARVAQAVCAVMGGSPERIMQGTRGSPDDILRRWVAMYIWRTASFPEPTLTEVGAAFGRDRTAVKSGLSQLRALWIRGKLSRDLELIRKHLRKGEEAFQETSP